MWCKIKHKDDFVFIMNIFYFDFMVTKKKQKQKEHYYCIFWSKNIFALSEQNACD